MFKVITFATYLVVCESYQFPKVTIPQYYIPIVNIRGINESMVFLRQVNPDNVLLTSLITGLYSDQTVLVARGEAASIVRKGLLNNDPNIIIVTEQIINHNELKSKAYQTMFKYYWSPVYLVMTVKNGLETCENGIFNTTYLKNVEECMNFIWHRYKVVRIIVSFPYTCPHHYIIYGRKKESDEILYDRTIQIIHATNKHELETAILENSKMRQLTVGYPLRANIFARFPTSITTCDNIRMYRKVDLRCTNDFCGLDGLVMNDFINYYQYNLTVPEDESCDFYGFVERDTQRITGALGCIVDKKIDISFNSRFMVMYTTNDYFYLHYITTDSLSVVLKIPDVIPLWHYAFNAFSSKTVSILGFLILLLGVITWASAWITKDIDKQEPGKLHVYVFNAMTSTMFGFPIKRIKRFRILRGTSLFCSISILALYQGNVNYQFTTRIRYKYMKTLQQLYESDTTLYTSPSFSNILMDIRNDQDKGQVAYLNKSVLKDYSLDYILENQQTATTSRGQDAQMQVLLNYTDETGSPLMYVVDEPFSVYYVSYICTTSFLFTEETTLFMMHLLEAGLPNKYYVWTRRSLRLGNTYPHTGADPRPTDKIALQHLRVAFLVLATGCVLSTSSFVVEVYRGRMFKKITAMRPYLH